MNQIFYTAYTVIVHYRLLPYSTEVPELWITCEMG